MESIKIVTKLDFKTLKYCNLFIMKYRRKTYLFYIILSVLSLGVVFADIFYFKSKYLAILSGLYIIYLIYQIFSVEAKLDQNLARFFSNRPVTTQTLEINEDNIMLYRANDLDNPIEFDWSFITEILEIPQYYMLMAGKTPIIVDRSDEAVLTGSQEALTALVNSKAETKPHKKVDFDIAKRPITFVHPEFPFEDVQEVESTVMGEADNDAAVEAEKEQSEPNNEDAE
ncbi:MAG: hypothetical protein M0R05_01815 [Bacilli bacterium]|nr:hypothetical protein [Bacilli bacterium]MDD4076364.1 hypothetical protein [Bacilli bacterium]